MLPIIFSCSFAVLAMKRLKLTVFLYLLFVWALLFILREQVDPNTVIYNTMGSTWTITNNSDRDIVVPAPTYYYIHTSEPTCLIVQQANRKYYFHYVQIIKQHSCTSLLCDSSMTGKTFNKLSSSRKGNSCLHKHSWNIPNIL